MSTISHINYWDQVNSWKNLWKFWNGPLCRNKSGPSPLLNVAVYWQSSDTETCVKKLSQILANNIDNGGRGIGLRIYVRCCRYLGKLRRGYFLLSNFLIKVICHNSRTSDILKWNLNQRLKLTRETKQRQKNLPMSCPQVVTSLSFFQFMVNLEQSSNREAGFQMHSL